MDLLPPTEMAIESQNYYADIDQIITVRPIHSAGRLSIANFLVGNGQRLRSSATPFVPLRFGQ